MGQLAAALAFLPLPGRSRGASPITGDERSSASDFGRWLDCQSADRQRPACLCLLLYWFACGDAPPDPLDKARLLSLDPRDLDEREAGKRAAYAQDVHAFADAVHRTLDVTDAEQRVQLLDLLLTVRACEGERSASENVLVRFLGNALGVRSADLARRYQAAYGIALAELPKLDPDDWWLARPEGADSEPPSATEACHRRRLGFAAHGPVEVADIEAAFERRHATADPALFHRLGRYERHVVARLRTRLVDARDALLERAA